MIDVDKKLPVETGSDPQGRTPTLHLSGPKLRGSLEALIRASETVGGIERFAVAVGLKGRVIAERLGEGRAATLSRADFEEIAALMPTVRRRVGKLIDAQGWPHVRAAIVELLADAHAPGTADMRIAVLEKALRGERVGRSEAGAAAGRIPTLGSPESRTSQSAQSDLRSEPAAAPPPRFLRDLAAEILHGVHPEHYPLMCRWVWDAKANTGVLREIWHDTRSGSDDVDRIVIDIPDSHETFLVLRGELSQFLADQGIFRDMLGYIDLLMAQVYGDYIDARGGAWLKTDFNAGASDPLEHTRRILGLDGRAVREVVKSPTREIGRLSEP